MCCNGVVTPGDPADIAAIKQLKYRYLRALDTKHWDDFTDTLAEDVTGDYGSSVGTELHFTNAPTWSTTCGRHSARVSSPNTGSPIRKSP